MSYNSSHLRTSSINFSSISEDNQAGLIASKHSKRSGDDVITAHMIRIEHVGPVPSRQTFSLGDGWRNGTETWLRRRKVYWTVTFCDGTETWRIVWIGPCVSNTHSKPLSKHTCSLTDTATTTANQLAIFLITPATII